MTVIQAISQVLLDHNQSMTPAEITMTIVDRQLYIFKAKDPLSIVRSQLRRHCDGIDLHCSHGRKVFSLDPEGRFRLREA